MQPTNGPIESWIHISSKKINVSENLIWEKKQIKDDRKEELGWIGQRIFN